MYNIINSYFVQYTLLTILLFILFIFERLAEQDLKRKRQLAGIVLGGIVFGILYYNFTLKINYDDLVAIPSNQEVEVPLIDGSSLNLKVGDEIMFSETNVIKEDYLKRQEKFKILDIFKDKNNGKVYINIDFQGSARFLEVNKTYHIREASQ